MASGTIKNSYGVTDLSITATAGSEFTIGSINFRQIGRIVFGYIYFDVTSALSDGAVIATLDRSLPKPYDVYTNATVRNASGSFGMVYIPRDVSGQIKAWGPIPVGGYNYAQFIYVLR